MVIRFREKNPLKLMTHGILTTLCSADLSKIFSQLNLSIFTISKYCFQQFLPCGKVRGYSRLLILWFINLIKKTANIFCLKFWPQFSISVKWNQNMKLKKIVSSQSNLLRCSNLVKKTLDLKSQYLLTMSVTLMLQPFSGAIFYLEN